MSARTEQHGRPGPHRNPLEKACVWPSHRAAGAGWAGEHTGQRFPPPQRPHRGGLHRCSGLVPQQRNKDTPEV